MATVQRALHEAFLLHSFAYSETSLIVELFTPELGRIAAVAKGAKRKGSALRSVLMPFQPIEISFAGKTELRTLTGAEWLGGMAMPVGDALICGFYMNELLMKLLAKEDPHPRLFNAYSQCLESLSQEAEEGEKLDTTLRSFEWQLLREVGYAPDLRLDSRGDSFDMQMQYRWIAGSGFVRETVGAREADGAGNFGAGSTVQGQTVAALGALLESGDNVGAAKILLSSPAVRMQAKRLTRSVLNHALDGQKLNSRQILIDLHRL
jgi:DNA repair protein RecO (recombination protein O)